MTACLCSLALTIQLANTASLAPLPIMPTYKDAILKAVEENGLLSPSGLKQRLKLQNGLDKAKLVSSNVKKLMQQQLIAKEGAMYCLGKKAKLCASAQYQEALEMARKEHASKASIRAKSAARERLRVARRLKEAGGLTALAKRDQREFGI